MFLEAHSKVVKYHQNASMSNWIKNLGWDHASIYLSNCSLRLLQHRVGSVQLALPLHQADDRWRKHSKGESSERKQTFRKWDACVISPLDLEKARIISTPRNTDMCSTTKASEGATSSSALWKDLWAHQPAGIFTSGRNRRLKDICMMTFWVKKICWSDGLGLRRDTYWCQTLVCPVSSSFRCLNQLWHAAGVTAPQTCRAVVLASWNIK